MQRRTHSPHVRRGARSALAATIVAAGVALSAHAEPPGVSSHVSLAADFALKGVDGGNLRLSEFRGEPVLLTFWGSWCGPCRESLATLQRFATDTGTPVVGVSLDGSRDRAAAVAGALRLTYPTLVDEHQQVARIYDVARLPLTLLIDRDGAVRATWAGTALDPRELSRSIASLARE